MRGNTFIDLFAGCGGLSLGLQQAGFQCIFMNEIDEKCCRTYLDNMPLRHYYVGDIKQLNVQLSKYARFFRDADLVCGGPPCQGFSTANRQRLIDDPRNKLYKEYVKFLSFVKPKFFLLENVKGIKAKADEIISDISKTVGSNYQIAYDVLDARDFGVPQHRERFIMVGNRIGVNSQEIFLRLQQETYPSFTLRDAIEDLPALLPNRVKNNTTLENDDIGFTSTKYCYKETSFRRFINSHSTEVDMLYNHKNRYNNDRDIEIFSKLPQGGNSLHDSIADIMPYKSRNAVFKDKYYKLQYDTVCKTITSHMRYDCNMYIHPTQARGLSPREAARIQTFPDSFRLTGPQNYWYHQIGNAVPVKLAEAIGKEILRCL